MKIIAVMGLFIAAIVAGSIFFLPKRYVWTPETARINTLTQELIKFEEVSENDIATVLKHMREAWAGDPGFDLRHGCNFRFLGDFDKELIFWLDMYILYYGPILWANDSF